MDTTTEALYPHDDTAQHLDGQHPPQPPSMLRKIFLGADGLRAGWGLLIFAVIVGVLGFCINFAIRKLGGPDPKTMKPGDEIPPLIGIMSEAVSFLLVWFVTWIMSKIEGRRISVYGLGGRRRMPHFFAGLAWGVACLSLLVLTLWKTGLLVFDGRLLFGSDILRYGAIWLFGFLVVGLLEEYVTRGYVQYTLTRGVAAIYQWAFKTPHNVALGFWTSAIVFSVLFGMGHKGNPGESPIGLLSAGLAGMVFCLSLWRTGSLWWAIGFHTSWDWAQSFVYGVADSGLMTQHHLMATHPVGRPILSGGTTGPEGSVMILGVFTLC
jgi:membrane protease YdiL (CAAX protease family)